MTQPSTINPLNGVPLIPEQKSGATAVPGFVYPYVNVWRATLPQAPQDRAIRGYVIAGGPNSQIDIWFENTLDDSTFLMGTSTQQEYSEPHILYKGLNLYIILTYYVGRGTSFSVVNKPIIRVMYHDQTQPGY